MRTTLELPDPLFARLKARAVSERLTLKQLLHSYVEQGLNATAVVSGLKRSARTSATRRCSTCSTREHLR